MIDDFDAVRPADDIDEEERSPSRSSVPEDPDEPHTWLSDFRPYVDDPA